MSGLGTETKIKRESPCYTKDQISESVCERKGFTWGEFIRHINHNYIYYEVITQKSNIL